MASGKYLIDEPISLGACGKCGAYVFVATDGGLRVVADIAPVDTNQMRDALISGRYLFDQVDDARGKPHWLDTRISQSVWPPKGKVLAEHPCNAGTRDVEVIANPYRVPVADTVTGTAMSATSHLSDRYLYRRCEACNEFIGLDRDVVGVWVAGYWEWVMHGRCVP